MAYSEVSVNRREHETRGRKKIHHLEIHPGDNGGHMVVHIHHGGQDSKMHHFGPEDGHKLMLHLAHHAKIKHDMAEEEHEPESERESEEEDGEE